MEPEIQQLVDKINTVQMPAAVRDDNKVQQVLEECWTCLQPRLRLLVGGHCDGHAHAIPIPSQHQQYCDHSTMLLLERMQGLLDAWIAMHLHSITRPETSRPFQILLEAWNMASTTNLSPTVPITTTSTTTLSLSCDKAGRNVLHRWYELLGGDLELCPEMEQYHQVLQIYSNVSTTMAHHNHNHNHNHNHDDIQRRGQVRILASVAQEASDVVDQLRTWGFTWTPKLETNAHLIRCLSRVIISAHDTTSSNSSTTSNNDHKIETDSRSHYDNESNHHAAVEAWKQLCHVLQEYVLPILDKKLKTKKGDDATVTSQQHQAEFYYALQSLCDALLAAKQIRILIQQQQKQFRQSDDSAFNDKSIVSIDDIWTKWGESWMELFLQSSAKPRLLSCLDYAEAGGIPSLSFHDSNFFVSDAYQMVIDAGESWQFLLCHFTPKQYSQSKQKQKQRQVASTIHNVLNQLEALGRERYCSSDIDTDNDNNDDNSKTQLLLYNALLRHYLLTIKAWEAEIPYLQGSDMMQAIQRRTELLEHWGKQHDALCKSTLDLDENLRKDMMMQSFNNLMMAKFQVAQLDDVSSLFADLKSYRFLRPDSTSYSALLKALADSTRPDAAAKAHKAWNTLRTTWRSNVNNSSSPAPETAVKPTPQHYTSVLVAWSRNPQRHGEAAKMAMDVFHKLYDDHALDVQLSNGHATIVPTLIHNATMLTVLARSRKRTPEIDSMTLA